MSEWQPIESAPRDGTSILVCDADTEESQLVVFHAQEDTRHGPYGVFCWKQPDANVLHGQRHSATGCLCLTCPRRLNHDRSPYPHASRHA